MVGVNHMQMDFTCKEVVNDEFAKRKPEVVIHCGAISDTGACSRDETKSYKVNVIGTEIIAKACRNLGVKLIFCSSDQVYSGSDGIGPHKENEKLCPSRSYGSQKLEAEEICRDELPDTVILRLSWMYDSKKMREEEHGNLAISIKEAISQNMKMKYPVHDYRSITNVWETVKNIEKAWQLPGGVYNFGSSNDCSTYQVVGYFLEALNADLSLLEKDEQLFAENPRNLLMDFSRITGHGISFLSTKEGIFEYIS